MIDATDVEDFSVINLMETPRMMVKLSIQSYCLCSIVFLSRTRCFAISLRSKFHIYCPPTSMANNLVQYLAAGQPHAFVARASSAQQPAPKTAASPTRPHAFIASPPDDTPPTAYPAHQEAPSLVIYMHKAHEPYS